ncbi:hypothetical protein [Candidatus Tisiphia endosymbiont of Ptychoptera albimana]|jgi:hypothetical protein
MDVKTVLNEVIKEHCPFIHNNRLNALILYKRDEFTFVSRCV